MNDDVAWLIVVAAGGAVGLALVVATALLWRNTRRLAARVADLEARTPTPAAELEQMGPADTAAYVITDFPEVPVVPEVPKMPAERIDGKLFADIVARESVAKAAGLAHGLKRALAPETRHRIRFEMKREVKRSRKQRRADLKAVIRQTRQDAA